MYPKFVKTPISISISISILINLTRNDFNVVKDVHESSTYYKYEFKNITHSGRNVTYLLTSLYTVKCIRIQHYLQCIIE